eukprot:scaffold324663_cov20-Prasinocladus_malaysianus.AAC.1
MHLPSFEVPERPMNNGRDNFASSITYKQSKMVATRIHNLHMNQTFATVCHCAGLCTTSQAGNHNAIQQQQKA